MALKYISKFLAFFTATAALLVATEAVAVETRLSGHVEAQVRWFQSSPKLSYLDSLSDIEQQSKGFSSSLAAQPEWRYQSANRKHDFSVVPFARVDQDDDERTHVDIRELYWLYNGNGWELLTGIDKVFWGVAESRHLVDTINQTDTVEDPDGEDKLGQPMVRLTLDVEPTLMRFFKSRESQGRNWGKMSLFLMPGFRERSFPAADGRLIGPLPVDMDDAVYTDGAKKDRVDLALRYERSFGKWDLGLHYFHGNSREPRLVPGKHVSMPVGSGQFVSLPTRLIPHYDLINQVGLDVQYTSDAWLGKFEGIVREGQGDTFGAVVAGVEYTKYQLFDSNVDLGLLVEYLYDDRDEDGTVAPMTPFDNDVFLGTRLSMNDTKNTQLLAGIMADMENGEYSFNVEAERRLTDSLSAEFLVRIFGGDEPQGAFSGLEKDDYAQFSLFYHFQKNKTPDKVEGFVLVLQPGLFQ